MHFYELSYDMDNYVQNLCIFVQNLPTFPHSLKQQNQLRAERTFVSIIHMMQALTIKTCVDI